jgi:dinuclear metal center YbgI/SA1388 family protein
LGGPRRCNASAIVAGAAGTVRRMLLRELVDVLEQIAPTRHAESWDNVGLLAGDPAQPASKAMLTIDYTPEVACEAAGEGCDVIVAYHPPIFDAVKRVVAGGLTAAVFDAIKRGVALYSPHTALDVADGGTNDMLADAIGLKDRAPLRLAQTKANQYKLVTFVPEPDVDRVAAALFNAGAGRIGNYTHCSFRSPGTGTFFGEEGATNPAVGQSGKLERADEIRIETVMPIARLTDVLAALRAAHPYEEPAFDLVQLAAPPEKLGQGRVGKLSSPTSREQVIDRIKRELGLSHLLIAGPTSGTVTTAACCAGSCGEFVKDALKAKAELFLTGELRHHDALAASNAGMTVVCTLHTNSERAVLKRVIARLCGTLSGFEVVLSTEDRDPFVVA